MKKISLFFFLLFSSNIFGQKFSIGVSGGYGLGIQRDLIGVSSSDSYCNGHPCSNNPKDSIKGSLGKGVKINLNFDYKLNQHFKIGCNAVYNKGAAYSVDTADTDKSSYGINYYNSSYKSSGKLNNISQFQLVPNIKYQFGKKIKPYFQLGLVVGLFGRLTEEANSSDTDSFNYSIYNPFPLSLTYRDTTTTNTFHEKIVYKNGVSYGVNVAVGFDDMLTENLYFFAQVDYVDMYWTPKEYVVSEYNVNGVDKMSSISSYKIKNPKRAYSSINTMIGIRYCFGKASPPVANK